MRSSGASSPAAIGSTASRTSSQSMVVLGSRFRVLGSVRGSRFWVLGSECGFWRARFRARTSNPAPLNRTRRFSTRLILSAHVCDDPINPGGQTRFPAEVGQSTVDPQEHVLGQILGPRPILHGAGNQREHQILEAVDQLLEGALVAGTA